ncbi:hypothetical protein A2U01_0086055, partial [Trifolium medium]|nr:hypothetical protein [Trifolium medium]
EQARAREKEGELVTEKRKRSLRNRRAKVRELAFITVSDLKEERMSIPPFPDSFHTIFFGFW